MSAGPAVIFKRSFNTLTKNEQIHSHLAYQRSSSASGAGVYSLITKPKYYQKPYTTDYDKAFERLQNKLLQKNDMLPNSMHKRW